MRKLSIFAAAFVLALGLAQCKKEQPAAQNETEGVRITLNVGPSIGSGTNGSRVDVNPGADQHVTFENGDKILVGYNGAYVGTLTYNNSQFEGSISATPSGDQPLYFYFLGNKQGTLTVGATTCTVNISDQTNELPVISTAESEQPYSGTGTYSATLENQCALVKFPLAEAAGSIKIGGMKNEATINFASPSIIPTGSTGDVRLYSKSDTEKWAILLPQNATPTNVVIGETNYPVTVPAIGANALLSESISTIQNTSTIIDLSTVASNTTVEDGAILRGTLNGLYDIQIAAGATVTLDGVYIDQQCGEGHYYPGIKCLGDATIILVGDNTLKSDDKAGIQAGPSGTTLTIRGEGKLTAEGPNCAIGSSRASAVGNIVIESGNITAFGGIGSDSSCDNITINGGEVTAISGLGAAIGGNFTYAVCGDITINDGTVIATCNSTNNYAGIGSAERGSCGVITLNGGTITATGGGGLQKSAPGIGSGQNGSCTSIKISVGVTEVKAIKKSTNYRYYCIGGFSGGNSVPLTIGGNSYDADPTDVTGFNVVITNRTIWTLTPQAK